MKSFYRGRYMRPGGAAAKNVVNPFLARRRRCGALRRNKKLLKFFIKKQD